MRTIAPVLEQCLRRANPNVATFVELSAPDKGSSVLRRAADQFLAAPSLVSMTPALSAVASPAGALTLASTATNLITQYTSTGGGYGMPQEQDTDLLRRGVSWQLDRAFPGAILRRVTARLKWLIPAEGTDVKLQIYRVHAQAGVMQRLVNTSTVETPAIEYTFTPLLNQPVVRKLADIVPIWDGARQADVVFDLTNYRLAIDPRSSDPPGPGFTGDLAELLFVISTTRQGKGDFVQWQTDTTSATTVAGVGLVRDTTWARVRYGDASTLWAVSHSGAALTFKLDIETYSPTSQEVYALTLPQLPSTGSVGRVVFERGILPGTSAALDLSTAGAGGPWTPVENAAIVATPQLTYHARLTMNASADNRRAPVVSAIGVEFRAPTDLTPEAIVEPMAQEVAVPWLTPSIAEGRVTVVRTGRRDYRDAAGEIASAGPDTALEMDIFLGSRHPAVLRRDWFRTTRASVSSREPTATAEIFSLLSFAKTLKKKIPERIESISTVHVVASSTTGQITIRTSQPGDPPQLSGVTPTGNEYDGQGYYVRIRKSSVLGVETGNTFTITGNTGLYQLDFTGTLQTLPAALAVGDEIEVHSGRFAQPALSFVNRDPAEVWWELLTVHRGVPSDRIGLADVGGVGRAGLPPKVTDIAPSDATTQAKRKVTLKIREAEEADKLIDQVSFILGGSTVEIGGQLVFRQVYPLRDAAGRVTVAPDPVAATFDPRDYFGLSTPTGREQRITVLACDYGVDTVAAVALPVSTTQYVDSDALEAYRLQDVEGLGTGVVPSEISRWCYNATDGGLFLATALAQQVVYATSTGLRPWSWTAIEAHPELMVGDTVVVITDQYTDFDPARKVAIRGMVAYPLTLIGASSDGRRFRGFLQGLAGITGVDVRGGTGTLQNNNPVVVGVGPTLDVQIKHTSSNGIITYTAANGAISLYIDGVGPSAVPASPITVARPAAGALPIEYSIKIIGTSGQIITETVTVLPVDADTNTVTPDLSLVASNPTATYQDFTPNATNPSGGTLPLHTVVLRGTTGLKVATSTPILDGVPFTGYSNGDVIRVNRAAFDTVFQASADFSANIAGGGTDRIVRTILNQVKTTFGPSLDVRSSTTSTQTTITYVGSGGTVELSIDSGAYSAAPASPIVVTRDASEHVYAFRIVADGQTVPGVAIVPKAPLSVSLVIGACFASDAGVTGPPFNRLEVPFTVSGMPAGTTYDVSYNNGGSNVDSQTGASASPVTFNGVTFAGSPGSGSVTVIAKASGVTITTAVRNKPYAF